MMTIFRIINVIWTVLAFCSLVSTFRMYRGNDGKAGWQTTATALLFGIAITGSYLAY
jgi:tryptophan-rich sensory protein